MSLASNIFQNKWLTDLLAYVQSAIQVLLLIVIIISLGIAWWRYQGTALVIKEAKTDAAQSPSEVGAGTVGYHQPVEFYTDLVNQRDLFRFSNEPANVAVSPEIVSPASQDLMGRFVVQGIVLDRNPLVIIKDVQTNKTHFIHRSEMLEGAELVDIRENRVIFNRSGETLELIKK